MSCSLLRDELDLPVDLNSEDDTSMPWGFVDEARGPSMITEGAWILVGSGRARAVAQVAGIEDGIVWSGRSPGPVDRHRHLMRRGPA